jgi:hypothetical protein
MCCYRLPVRKFSIDDRFDMLIAAGIIINLVLMTLQVSFDTFRSLLTLIRSLLSDILIAVGIIINLVLMTLQL